MRLTFIICSIGLAAIAAWYGQPYVHHNSDFVVIVVTVFTVFAGFLIAIITILRRPLYDTRRVLAYRRIASR